MERKTMRVRTIAYSFIVTLFVLTTFLISVHAADITHTYEVRGAGSDQSSSEYVTGKICRMVNNTFYMIIDPGTSNRYIDASLSYLTQGFLGIYVVRDSFTIINHVMWGNPSNTDTATVTYQINNKAFTWVDYSNNAQCRIRLTTSGANSSYCFHIYNAEFNFANYK
jgi:hypothetical protein